MNKPNGILAFGRQDKSAEIIRKNSDKIVCNLNISFHFLHFVSIMVTIKGQLNCKVQQAINTVLYILQGVMDYQFSN